MLNKVWYLLDSEQRSSAIVIACLMLVGMLLETLGLGLVIPVLTLIIESDLIETYPFMLPILDMLGSPSHEQLVIIAMLSLVVVYFVKTLYLAFLAWRQAKYISGIDAELSHRLFSQYLRQPYAFHLQRNSAQLIRNTINFSGTIAGVIHQSLLIAMEALVLLGISILLINFEPLGAFMVMSLFCLSGCCYSYITRKHMLRWGEESATNEGLRIQHVQQGLGAAKDLKLLGRGNGFIEQYNHHNIRSAHLRKRQSTFDALPRLILELFAVAGLASLVIVMVNKGNHIGSLLPIIGLFAASAFRLLPSVNRVISAVQYLRFTLPVVNTIYDEVQLFEKIKPSPCRGTLSFEDNLSLSNVNFNYLNTKSQTLTDINLKVPKGSTIGFIGESGAGKSTLVDIILGLLTPETGKVKVDGVDIETSIRGWQERIGYVPQSIYLTDDTLRRNIAFGLHDEKINENSVLGAVKAAQLDQFVKSLPEGLDTVVGERGVRLSGGQQQRIGIARSLYHDPSVLVLDEATSSLDTDTEREVMDAVRKLHGKKTILIVAHRLSTVEDCDYLYHLEAGKIIDEGAPNLILNQCAVNVE